MSSRYEFWLSNDEGRRLALLKNPFAVSYARAVSGLGTLELWQPFRAFAEQFNPWFQPDWRIEAWRSPMEGIPLRCEDVYMLRKPNVYTRVEDGMDVIVFYGRNGLDLLRRRHVIQLPGTSYAEKTDFTDDMMKEIVRQQMLFGSALDSTGAVDNSRAWPEDEFQVQGDVGLGPTTTRAFAGRNVLDILKDLRKGSIQLHLDNESNDRIYFDVAPLWLDSNTAPSGALQGWEFRTYNNLRGGDRTTGIEFSVENENMKQPEYSISHMDEVNVVQVTGNGNGASQQYTTVSDSNRAASSRWNRCEKVVSAGNESSTTGLTNVGSTELGKGKPKEELNVTFLNNPGGPRTPRSLYGVDWDLGDLVRVNVAKKQFEAEISIVYVAINEQGQERISARNVVNEQ